MRTRSIRVQLWLNQRELETLDKQVKRSGLTREAYLRHLIAGLVPRDAPPPDYYAFMRELYRIGNNLNQIAQKAHLLQVLDVQRYDANTQQLEQTIRRITDAVILPQPLAQQSVTAQPPAAQLEYNRSAARQSPALPLQSQAARPQAVPSEPPQSQPPPAQARDQSAAQQPPALMPAPQQGP